MAIKADEFGYDMSRWVAEKSLKVLRDACSLADWIHKENNPLPAEDVERVSDLVTSTIFNSAKLYMFGCENTSIPLQMWTEILFSQGCQRLEEFSDVVTGKVPADTAPQEYPASVQRVIDRLSEARSLIDDEGITRTLRRLNIAEIGEELQKSRESTLHGVGKRLLELIDQQTYHASISWEDFVVGCRRAIDEASRAFLEKMSRYRWEPNRAPSSGES